MCVCVCVCVRTFVCVSVYLCVCLRVCVWVSMYVYACDPLRGVYIQYIAKSSHEILKGSVDP